MAKKVLWAIILITLTSFAIRSNDPINDAANFIIAGSIPGTNESIGMWSTLLVAGFLLSLVWLGIKSTAFQMLEHTAKQIKQEEAKEAFEESNMTFDHSKRSVIAAPSHELTS